MKIIYYGHFEKPSDCENWIANALNRNGHHCIRVDKGVCNWEHFLTDVSLHRPDACLFTKIPEIPMFAFKRFRESYKGKIIFWTFDWMMHPSNKWFLKLGSMADICFMTDGTDPDGEYKALGINRVELHQAADVQHNLPKLWREKSSHFGLGDRPENDVVLLGSLYTQRRKDLDAMLRDSYGPGYSHHGNPGTELWGEDFARTCYLSKIIVGDNYVNDVPGYWSDRVYLTLGCGGFFVTAKVPGLGDRFTSGRHLVSWDDFEDLRLAIDYYLDPVHEPERRAMALEGYRFVQDNHTYDNRIEVFNREVSRL